MAKSKHQIDPEAVTPPKVIASDQLRPSADGILLAEDLPKDWYLVDDRWAGERQYDISDTIDIALGYDGGWSPGQEEHDLKRREDLAADWRAGRWKYIEHVPTGTRVLLRIAEITSRFEDLTDAPRRVETDEPEQRVEGEVRITSVVFMPRFPGRRIASRPMQRFPLAEIEAKLNKRLFGKQQVHEVNERQEAIKRAARQLKEEEGRLVPKRSVPNFTLRDGDLEKEITRDQVFERLRGDPRREPLLYAWAALQYELIDNGNWYTTTPVQKLAEINDVPLSTAQGWVREARKRGLLPPVRPGQG